MEVHVTFVSEKITQNTVRFKEVFNVFEPESEHRRPGEPVVGALYLKKWALKALGEGAVPDQLEVTIEVVD